MRSNTVIDGIGASQVIDSSGEILDISKLDISSLGADDSVFNFEHKSKETPSQIVGKVTYGKKIFKKSDCSNDRERYWWDKVRKPFLYVKGELFDGEGHRGAEDVAAIFRYKNRHKGKLARKLMGFSIEGGTMDRQGILLGHSLARDIAITVKPCNKTCIAEIVEDETLDLYKSEASRPSYSDADVEGILKEEYPEMKKPKMDRQQAQKEFGKVTVRDGNPSENFGKVKVKDQSGRSVPPSRSVGTKVGGNPYSGKSRPANVGGRGTAPAGFAESMSSKYQGTIPEGTRHRKQMAQHILNTHKEGKINEARRLYDRFMSGGGSFTKGTRKSERWEDRLPGGLADNKKPSDFDSGQLAMGIEVEMEHTDDVKTATEIAMDHLTEDPKYYDKLKEVESKHKSKKLEKALTAGSGMGGAPSSWTQGRALSSEDMGTGGKKSRKKWIKNCTYDGKDMMIEKLSKPGSKRKMKKHSKKSRTEKSEGTRYDKMNDLFKSWPDRGLFIDFLEKRIPELTKKEKLALAKVYCLKIHEEAESTLDLRKSKSKPKLIASAPDKEGIKR